MRAGKIKTPRAKIRAPQQVQDLEFRSLNLPVPIQVASDKTGMPAAVALPHARSRRPRPAPKSQYLRITAINDLWQVDDEWWRKHPIARRYYQITIQDDRRLTIYQDRANDQWYWQRGGEADS
ncbi:MAG: hypothetical protein CL759_07080 [Chloroflexi bacterium]|nr:hypothetical protein [Chloroflexota bacterium]|tara:strand:- start:295 stop:663 length:369 start_codon:yes stop_codon:yes gene_type:complete